MNFTFSSAQLDLLHKHTHTHTHTHIYIYIYIYIYNIAESLLAALRAIVCPIMVAQLAPKHVAGVVSLIKLCEHKGVLISP